jgi:uncharacterized membrane protein
MYNISSQSWSAGSESVSLAWKTYKEQIGAWVLFYICIIGINLFCSLIPYVGTLLSSFSGIILGGVFVGAIHNYVVHKKDFSTDMISEIVEEHINDLVKLGALSVGFWFLFYFCALFAVGGIFIATIGLSSLDFSSPDDFVRVIENIFSDQTMALILLTAGFFILSLFLIFGVLYFMAFVFAPYLIIVEKEEVFRALTMSFTASQNNMWSLTSISLWWILLSFIGVITCCFGLLVTGPMITISTYYLATMIFVRTNNLSLDKEDS